MSKHYTVDELAELDAGLLARRRAAAAERHLADCDACSHRADAIRKTRAALADLGPANMPADVAARLDRTLRDIGATSTTDVIPTLDEARARRQRVPNWAYGAAAAVLAVAAVGIALGTGGGHHGTAGAIAKPPIVATSAPPQLIQEASGRTYTPDSLDSFATGLLGASPLSADAAGTAPTAPRGAAGLAPGTAGGSGTTTNQYSNKNAAPLPSATGHRPGTAVAEAPAQSSAIPPSLQRYASDRRALLQCAAFISDTANAQPLAVDFGRWSNAKAGIHNVAAMVMVFDDPQDPNSIDVIVVGAACNDSSLLDFQIFNKQ